LKKFPIDELKIDRSFVLNIPTEADDSAIANTIISMAHTLNLRVIAEGVEKDDQLDFLRESGCGEIQGFIFSPPVPPAQFEQLLIAQRRINPE
jgi:EAL domain-containing protein (putative c-di-GMP-specific phosphodiesterase class I)